MIDNPKNRAPILDPTKFPKNIWEMHPDETSTAFNYFATYRDMGVGSERSLRKCAELLGLNKNALTYYSGAQDWFRRAKSYDAYVDVEVGKEKIKALKAMTKTHMSNMRTLSTALMLPFNEMLARKGKPTGDFTQVELENLYELMVKGAPSLIKIVDTERKINDQPNEIIKNQHELAPEIRTALPKLTDNLKKKIAEEYAELGKNNDESSDDSDN